MPRAISLITLLAAFAGCGPTPPSSSDGGSSTGSGTTQNTSTTGALPTTGATDDSGIGSSTTDPGIIHTDLDSCFAAAPSQNGLRCSPCSTWLQDCPDGEKCMPWSVDLDDTTWDFWKCIPLPPDPAHVGEPCVVEGSPKSGVDNCDEGSMCWHVDPDTLEGTCVPFCTNLPDDPVCPDGTACLIADFGVLAICVPT